MEFRFTGTVQLITLPNHSWVSQMWVYIWGAGGGSGSFQYIGGGGAYVEGLLNVTPGQTLHVIVGQGGGFHSTSRTFGGGGSAAHTGGGRSAIQFPLGTDIVTAGGGEVDRPTVTLLEGQEGQHQLAVHHIVGAMVVVVVVVIKM